MAADEEGADSPAGTPGAHDGQEQSLARYATIVGVVTGLFGMLLGVGFILLPSATMQEKLLIIGACLAVSAAGATGAGAWRSPRGFGLTMLAGGLAIACLADLSIAAADGAKATTVASGSHQAMRTSRPSEAPSPSRSPAATPALSATTSTPRVTQSGQSAPSSRPDSPTETSASQPETAYLSPQQETGDTGADQAAPLYGTWAINGISYRHSLGYDGNTLCTARTDSTIYDLTGSYDDFLSEVGIADGWTSGEQPVVVYFKVYAETDSGGVRELKSAAAQAGRPSSLAAPIPAGTKELRVTTVLGPGCLTSDIVWGDARLTRSIAKRGTLAGGAGEGT